MAVINYRRAGAWVPAGDLDAGGGNIVLTADDDATILADTTYAAGTTILQTSDGTASGTVTGLFVVPSA